MASSELSSRSPWSMMTSRRPSMNLETMDASSSDLQSASFFHTTVSTHSAMKSDPLETPTAASIQTGKQSTNPVRVREYEFFSRD
jgi:hypothetical protein